MEDQYVVQNLATTQGLDDETITKIIQSADGFLWIGTNQGIVKYSGNKITKYSPFNIDKNFAPALHISDISESPSGQIWVSTADGTLSHYNELKDNFNPHRSIEEIDSYQSLTSITTYDDNNVWLGTKSGVGVYNTERDRTSSIVTRSESGQEIGFVNKISSTNGNEVIIAAQNGLFLAKLPNTDYFSSGWRPKVRKLAIESRNFTSLSIINGNYIWAGTAAGKLYKLDINLNIIDQIDVPESFTSSSVTALGSLDNELLIGTHDGLIIYDSGLDKFLLINRSTSSISNDHVSAIFATDKLAWVGTYRGVNHISRSQFSLFNSTNREIDNEVLSIVTDNKQRAWIGTYNGLYYSPSADTQIVRYDRKKKPRELSDKRIMSLEASENRLWVGTRQNGVDEIDLETLEARPLLTTRFLDAAITDLLYQQHQDTLWIGTYNYGLLKISKREIKSYLANNSSKEVIPEKSITTLTTDISKKFILIGSERSLYAYLDKQGAIQKIETIFSKQHISPTFLTTYISKSGRLWLGTLNQGLFYSNDSPIHTRTARFSQVSQSEILKSSSVYSIEEDEIARLWCATSSGIYLLDAEGRILKRFGKSDGLQGNDFNFQASHKDTSGLLYFGGSNGYNRFNPSDIVVESTPPPLVLTDITIAGSRPTLTKPIKDLQSLELDYLDYYVTFEFSILDYLDTANNQYRYKLEGFDPNWIEVGNRNTATYTSLPAGSYEFRVQGASSAGVWNREGISTSLRVNPAPWNSWWAYCLYAGTALVLAWHAKKTYDNAVIRRRAIQMAQEMQETADRAMDDVQEQLDHQSRLVESIHRFNLAKLALVKECFTRHAEFLPSTVNAAYVGDQERRVNALACLEKSLLYKYDALLADLHKFTDMLASELLADKEQRSNTHVTVINEVCDELFNAKLALPLSIVLYELFSNAVDHAFDPDSYSCFIKIEVTRKSELSDGNDVLVLSVFDNGVGLPAGIDFQSPQSAGIATVADTVAMLGGTISVSANQGTQVLVTIPTSGLPIP